MEFVKIIRWDEVDDVELDADGNEVPVKRPVGTTILEGVTPKGVTLADVSQALSDGNAKASNYNPEAFKLAEKVEKAGKAFAAAKKKEKAAKKKK